MTPHEQNLLDQYVRGTLSLEHQAEFDSRFSNNPLFSEAAVQTLASHLGEPDANFVEETSRRLDGRAAALWAQAGLTTVEQSFGLEFKSLATALGVLVVAYGALWLNHSQDAARAHKAQAPIPAISFVLPAGELSAWENRSILPEASAPQAVQPKVASAAGRPAEAVEADAPQAAVEVPSAKQASLEGKVLRIKVEVPRDVHGKVTLTDAKGLLVRHLFNGKMPAGSWALDWDQRNDQGARVPAGDYIVRIETGGKVMKGQVSVSAGS